MNLTKLTATLTLAALACASPAQAEFIILSVQRSISVQTSFSGNALPDGPITFNATIAGPLSGPWTDALEHGETTPGFTVFARSQQTSLVRSDTISSSLTVLASRSAQPSSTFLQTTGRADSGLAVRFALLEPTFIQLDVTSSTNGTGDYDASSYNSGLFRADGPPVFFNLDGPPASASIITLLPAGEYYLSSLATVWYRPMGPRPAGSRERTIFTSIRIVPSPGIAAAIIPAAAIICFRRRRRD